MDYTLITGASGGIGLALSEICAEHGHNLILTARRENRLREIKEELENRYPIRVEVLAADLSEPDGAQRLYDSTSANGWNVTCLVNNAGYGDHAAFLDSDWKRQEKMVQLNVTAMMRLSYLYGNEMRNAGKGHILNLSSVAAFCAGPYMSIYYATKGFVLSFSLALGRELHGSGVTVTAICPGPTSTGFESAAKMNGSKMFTFLKPQTAESVALRAYQAMMRGKPVVYHSAMTHLGNLGSRLVSRNIAAWFAEKINTKPKEEE